MWLPPPDIPVAESNIRVALIAFLKTHDRESEEEMTLFVICFMITSQFVVLTWMFEKMKNRD